VIDGKKVPSAKKFASLLEAHTDIIIKAFRDFQYGHKINLSTEKHGLTTCLSIEKCGSADSERFFPMHHAQ
jgi:IS5 family transposase